MIEYGRNSYAWRYVPPLPWLLIILGILLFIAICVAIFVWYRRRQRRIALERYALKRARRKLKVPASSRVCGSTYSKPWLHVPLACLCRLQPLATGELCMTNTVTSRRRRRAARKTRAAKRNESQALVVHPGEHHARVTANQNQAAPPLVRGNLVVRRKDLARARHDLASLAQSQSDNLKNTPPIVSAVFGLSSC